MKFKISLLALLFVSISAYAADWRMSYINPHAGSLLIDQDSIINVQGSEKNFWTLFAPRVTMGQPSEGYAYNKTQHQIDCAKRTSVIQQVIYYDEYQKPHPTQVEDNGMHGIIPDSDDDLLWQYVCKPERQKDLAAPSTGGIAKFLEDQARYTRENLALRKQQAGQ